MILGLNEHGTSVSIHHCPDCGEEFTCCPPADQDWGGCVAETCESYDPARDVEIWWDAGVEHGLIQRTG